MMGLVPFTLIAAKVGLSLHMRNVKSQRALARARTAQHLSLAC